MAGVNTDAELRTTCQNIGIGEGDIQFLLDNGETFIGRANLLAKRLGISRDHADTIVELITKSTHTDQVTNEDAMKIDQCLKDDPSINTPIELNLALGIKINVVATYMKSKRKSEKQDERGKSSRLQFSEKEGKNVLSIIHEYFPFHTEENIRMSIVSNDLNMKDKIICDLKKQNPIKYSQLVTYLAKFKNSKEFEKVDACLTFDEMRSINANNQNVFELSKELKKVETVVKEFKGRFSPKEVEMIG